MGCRLSYKRQYSFGMRPKFVPNFVTTQPVGEKITDKEKSLLRQYYSAGRYPSGIAVSLKGAPRQDSLRNANKICRQILLDADLGIKNNRQGNILACCFGAPRIMQLEPKDYGK